MNSILMLSTLNIMLMATILTLIRASVMNTITTKKIHPENILSVLLDGRNGNTISELKQRLSHPDYNITGQLNSHSKL